MKMSARLERARSMVEAGCESPLLAYWLHLRIWGAFDFAMDSLPEDEIYFGETQMEQVANRFRILQSMAMSDEAGRCRS